jgi:Tol biopolymer transport system component
VPILAAIAAAVITPTIASYFRQPPRPPLRKFAIPKESANDSWVRENVPAISPDGSRVAYADGDRLRIRSLDALDALVVSGTGTAGLPTWSPDGRFIAYFIDHRTLWKVAAEGGNPQKICDLPPGLVFGLAWKPDRTIVVNMAYGPAAGELFTISENGGRPEKIRAPHLEEAAVFYLRGLPDGSLTYARIRKGERGETIFEEPGKAPKVLPIPRHSGVVYAPSGHLVYAGIETTGIWAVPFDRSSASVTGEPYRIADNGVGPTVSADGTLAYGRSIPGSRQLWWVDRDGTIRRPIGQPQDDMYEPALSPDGTRVAVVGVEKGASNIWLHDIGRAAKTRLTFDHEENPVWHPTEPRIAFRRQWDLFSLALDGRSEPVSVVATPVPEYWPQWSADGRYLLFGHYGQKTQGDIWMFEPGAKEPKPFLASPFNEAEFSFSRDGRHIAYISDETGRSEVFVRVSGGRRHSAAVIRRRRIPDMESPRRRGLLRRGSHVDVGVGAHAAVAAV